MNKLLLFCFVARIYSNLLFSADNINFSMVLHKGIYDLNNMVNISSDEDIKNYFLEKKRAALKLNKTAKLEQRLKEYNQCNRRRNLVKYGGACISLMASLSNKNPSSGHIVSHIIIGLGLSEMLATFMFGKEIPYTDIANLEREIDSWTTCLARESCTDLEILYVLKKHKNSVAVDLQHQIENVFIQSRSSGNIPSHAEDFIRTALKMPQQIKQPNDNQKISLNDEILDEITNDIRRCTLLANGILPKDAYALKLRFCGAIIDKDDTSNPASKIAHVLDLPYHDFKPDNLSEEIIFGSNCYGKHLKKGELVKAFIKDEENYKNLVLHIDYDYLATLSDSPQSCLWKLLETRSFLNPYLNAVVDLQFMHIFITSKGLNDRNIKELRQFAKDKGLRLYAHESFIDS